MNSYSPVRTSLVLFVRVPADHMMDTKAETGVLIWKSHPIGIEDPHDRFQLDRNTVSIFLQDEDHHPKTWEPTDTSRKQALRRIAASLGPVFQNFVIDLFAGGKFLPMETGHSSSGWHLETYIMLVSADQFSRMQLSPFHLSPHYHTRSRFEAMVRRQAKSKEDRPRKKRGKKSRSKAKKSARPIRLTKGLLAGAITIGLNDFSEAEIDLVRTGFERIHELMPTPPPSRKPAKYAAAAAF